MMVGLMMVDLMMADLTMVDLTMVDLTTNSEKNQVIRLRTMSTMEFPIW